MGVRESIGYALECDFPGCGRDTEGVNGEYGSCGDLDTAVDEWRDHEGYHGDEGTYCAEHTLFDEDEYSEHHGIRPMLPTIDNLFVLAERRIAERIRLSALTASCRVDNRVRSLELRDASFERRVRVRMGDGGWHDLVSRSQRLVAVNVEAREALAHG